MIKLLRWFAGLPLSIVHTVGAFLGWMTVLASPSYRARLRDHSQTAGLTAQQRRRSVAQAGCMVAELPWLWLAPAHRRIGDFIEWSAPQHMQAALDQGRGLVLLTPHLGSFEVCARAYAERFGQQAALTALYRPARQAWLRELEEAARERPGLHTAPANLAGVRQMIRALRRGETVGLLPDQVPPQGLGTWATFFGREAYTMTLASRLLEQTGASLLLMWAERLERGRGWRVHVLRPGELLTGPAPTEAPPDPQAINHLMERLILRAPEQYLWGYHRYKHPRQPGPGDGG